MPYARKTTKSRAKPKRKYKRKTQAQKAKASVCNSVILFNPRAQPFQETKLMNLTYRSRLPYTLSSGSTTSHVFRLNSCYDLDYSNTMSDRQPLFYDQIVATGMYPFYKVNNIVIKIKVTNLTDGGYQASDALGVYSGGKLYQNKGILDLTIPPITAARDIPNNIDTYSESILVPGTCQLNSVRSGQTMTKTVSLDIVKRMKKLGLDHVPTSNATNPTDTLFWYFFVGDEEIKYYSGGENIYYSMDVEIVQTVEFSRLAPVEST